MHVNVENLESAFWNEDNYNGVVKLSSLQLNQDVQQYYYVSTKLNVTDNILNNKAEILSKIGISAFVL